MGEGIFSKFREELAKDYPMKILVRYIRHLRSLSLCPPLVQQKHPGVPLTRETSDF